VVAAAKLLEFGTQGVFKVVAACNWLIASQKLSQELAWAATFVAIMERKSWYMQATKLPAEPQDLTPHACCSEPVSA
jgi:hypothetical protein